MYARVMCTIIALRKDRVRERERTSDVCESSLLEFVRRYTANANGALVSVRFAFGPICIMCEKKILLNKSGFTLDVRASLKRRRSHRTELCGRAPTSDICITPPTLINQRRRRRMRETPRKISKKKKEMDWTRRGNYNAFARWLSMNTNRERVRIERAYIRGFPRQRLCKAGLARLVQPVRVLE